MQNKNASLDIVNEVLEACILAYPVSSFIISLYKQYQQRGSLSKKQLEGLHAKASSVSDLPPGKLATLQAIINRMPNRFKSDMPEPKPVVQKDEAISEIIQAILQKYPQHKRVLFLQSRYDNNEQLTPSEIADLKRLHQLLKV